MPTTRSLQPPSPLPPPDLVPVETFAERAGGVSTLTVRRWIRNGILPAYKIVSSGRGPGLLRVSLRDLELVVQRYPVQK
jgi:hypothetical protein